MKKEILDYYSWACAYSIYHPVFYSCLKTNYTPAHSSSWPIKKIYTQEEQNNIRYLKVKDTGDLEAYRCAQEYPKIKDFGYKTKRILLKRFAAQKDINALSKLFTEVTDDEYYLVAKCIIEEGSVKDLMTLIEKGLESKKAPPVGLLGDIMKKAFSKKDYKSCDRIWEILGMVERDFKVEKCVLIKLRLIQNDKDLFQVYRKVLEWNVFTKKVKRGIMECADRISSPYLRDWAFRTKMGLESHKEINRSSQARGNRVFGKF